MNLDDRLLACLRGETGLAELENLLHDEWFQLAGLAWRHGVVPLLHHRTASSEHATLVPPDVASAMHQEFLGTASRNLRLYHNLAQVLQALNDRQVPTIALKGAHLAQLVYTNIALRRMADIDLLLHHDDLSRAVEALERLGYRQHGGLGLGPDEIESHHLPPMVKPGSPAIELHWTLVTPLDPMGRPNDPFSIDLDGLWQRAEEVVLAGVRTKVLSSEDLLLHLSVHLTQHHRFRTGVRTACDVAALLESRQGRGVNWSLAEDSARRWRVERCVYLTLALARDMLAVSVPDDVLARFEPPGVDPGLVAQARRIALETPPLVSSRVSRIWQAGRWRDKLAGLFTVAFPSRRTMATMYPAPPGSWRIYLYYPVRVRDLIARHGRRLWSLTRRDPEALAWADHERRTRALVDWVSRQG